MTDFLTVGGFVLSAIGVAFSVYALCQADGAKRAVARALNKGDEQVTRDDSRDLLNKLNAAKGAALARGGRSSRGAIVGRNINKDVEALKQAQDGLAMTVISTDALLEQDLRVASQQLLDAINNIQAAAQRDGWADALGVLQGITPKVNTHQRQLGSNAIRS
jgi:hypothetical protein